MNLQLVREPKPAIASSDLLTIHNRNPYDPFFRFNPLGTRFAQSTCKVFRPKRGFGSAFFALWQLFPILCTKDKKGTSSLPAFNAFQKPSRFLCLWPESDRHSCEYRRILRVTPAFEEPNHSGASDAEVQHWRGSSFLDCAEVVILWSRFQKPSVAAMSRITELALKSINLLGQPCPAGNGKSWK
jgi:hypothetical protein